MENTILSSDQKRLLALMRDINYGSIKNFEVRDGVLTLPKHLESSRKAFFDLRHTNKPDWDDDTHASMPEVVDLFEFLATVGSIRINRLHVDGGLPTEIEYVLLDEDPQELAGGL